MDKKPLSFIKDRIKKLKEPKYKKHSTKQVLTAMLGIAVSLGTLLSTISVNTITAYAANTWTYNYTGGVQTFTANKAGQYYIEMYGASGGGYTDSLAFGGTWQQGQGGYGGKTTGYINLASGQKLYIQVGQAGSINGGASWNGGGAHGGSGSGSGGGATSITTTNRGVLANFVNNTNEVVAVAGGGGGRFLVEHYHNNTGSGGALNGGDTNSSIGGSQITGYAFGQGGSGSVAGGGGGGYYGGTGSSKAQHGGAGGSGYVGGLYNATSEYSHYTGNGTVKITYVGSVTTSLTMHLGNGINYNGQYGNIVINGEFGSTKSIKLQKSNDYQFNGWTLNKGNFNTSNGLSFNYTFGSTNTEVTADYVAPLTLKASTESLVSKGYLTLRYEEDDPISKDVKLYEKVNGNQWINISSLIDNAGLNTDKEFTFTGGVQTFKVPVSGIYHIVARGAQGGNGGTGMQGGTGAIVQSDIFLNAGQTLYIYVGGSNGYNGGGTTGNGGSSSSYGGYGGGATTISLTSTMLQNSNITNASKNMLVVAGGGGGAGGGGSRGGSYYTGGYGGASAQVGSSGRIGNGGENETTMPCMTGHPGSGASQSGAGSGGSTGTHHSHNADDYHSCGSGGGGGGGWYGGGGGGGGFTDYASSSDCYGNNGSNGSFGRGGSGGAGGPRGFNWHTGSGAGGGGGSSWINPSGENNSYTTGNKGNGSLSISINKVGEEIGKNTIGVYARDKSAPNVPYNGRMSSIDGMSAVEWNHVDDNGDSYTFKAKSFRQSNGSLLRESSEVSTFALSGLKGYHYYLDNLATGTVTTSNTFTYNNYVKLSVADILNYRYIHIASIDYAGNISGTYTFSIPQIYNVNIYPNKPSNASNNIVNKNPSGWKWNTDHYQNEKLFIYGSTTIGINPSGFYSLTGWTIDTSYYLNTSGTGTSYNSSSKNLTTPGSTVNLYVKWKPNPYPYEIHYYFQNINGKGYTEDTKLVATIKAISYMDSQVNVPLPTVAGYKYSSMKIANGGRLKNGKITIINEDSASVAKKNVVSVYYNWDDGNNTGGGDSAKNLGLVTFDTNKLNWHLDPGANISASWKWTPTSTTNSASDGFNSPENVQGYFVQRLYASEGSNVTSGYGAFISRGQSEIQLKSIADKYKGNGGGNNKNWGGDFPTVTATGCTFLGWNSKADGSGKWYSAYGSGNKSGSDKSNTAVLVIDSTNKKYGQTYTLYAIWADNAQVKASITYNQGVVNDVTGIAGTAGNLEAQFENKTSTTVSTSGSIVTLPWSKDVAVNITGQDKATGNYLFYSKLIGADNSHKNQDAGTTTIFAAGLGEDSGTVNALSNSIKRETDANKSKTTSGAYTQNEGTYHLDYNVQGTYAVSVRNESREYEKAIKDGVIQGDPAYKHLNNIFKIKIDNTAPVITSWRVTQDRLENYKSSEIEDAIADGLYTTFKISFSDAHNSAKGAYLNQRDTSGIQGIYIRVWDKNDTSNVKVYSVPLERVTNKTLTDNEDAALFSGTVTYPINLYAEFPKASSIIYEAYVVDNAGNVTEKIGSVIVDKNKPGGSTPLPDPDEGPEEPSDPSDPTPSPSPDYPNGTLTNFSIKTVIYNDKDEEFNVEDFVTYGTVTGDVGAFFQTGDIGHVDVWTVGYVTSVSPDFGAGAGDSMAEEAIEEITSGRLPAKYNMGLDSVGDYKRIWNYSMAQVLKPKYISYYDEDLHKMVTVYRDATVKATYSTKAYTAKEQQLYNKLVIHDGIPYAAYYTTKADVIADDTAGWLGSGTKVRIPPYYQMKYPYSKSEKTHKDGTTAYKTETHTYKVTAYKDGDTSEASWIYMIYDMGLNDLHFRTIHEN